MSNKQCGSKLGTTQLFPAATVPRNAEQQLEAAPEDAPEAAPRLNVPPLEDKWTASNRLLPAHADGTFGAAGAPAHGALAKQKPCRRCPLECGDATWLRPGHGLAGRRLLYQRSGQPLSRRLGFLLPGPLLPGSLLLGRLLQGLLLKLRRALRSFRSARHARAE